MNAATKFGFKFGTRQWQKEKQTDSIHIEEAIIGIW